MSDLYVFIGEPEQIDALFAAIAQQFGKLDILVNNAATNPYFGPIADTPVDAMQKTIDVIGKASPRQKIFIVAETPEDVLTLVKGGVPIKKVNIGNMHMSEGKRQVATSVAVNDEDVAAFKELQELGVELEIRRVPSTPVEDTSKLFS